MTYSIPHTPSGLPLRRPNLILFMPDQLRYDALHCSGLNPHLHTPNIDAFANRGVRFTECYVQASVCSQSRCSMFTGRYPHVSGHRSLETLLQPWEPNLFRALKEGGYHVACLAPRGDLFAPAVTELSLTEYGFLEPPEFRKVIGSAGQPEDSRPEEEISIWERLFYAGRRDAAQQVDYDEAASGYQPRYMQMIRSRYGTHRATPEIWAEVAATYHGMIARLDDQFGRIVAQLEATGLWDQTVTLFFTDHGEYLGDHGLIEKWPSGLSETLVREPLILAGGGLPQQQVRDTMVEMVDLVPTVLQLCGLDETFPHNGKSLLPTILHNTPHRQFAFSEGGFLRSEEPLLERARFPYDLKAGLQHEDVDLVGKAIAIRNREWTYIYRLYEPAELYNRTEDPLELHNLAAEPEHIPMARYLESQVFRWMVETSDLLPYTKDPRFPEVDLPSPRQLWEKRKEKQADS
ncbi:hypothetical protein AbraIFM66950_012231 [Aspergillus brasiliensis]|nr:hypothetical protein AbraIFM66950_012231 [Aspergillus brasiliensis]